MPAETAQSISFDEAFQAAKAEHTKAAEEAPAPVEPTPEGDTSATTTPQSEEPEKAADQTQDTAETELLSKEELGKLDEAGKLTYRKMQAAYTRKTQTLAKERKQFEQYRKFIDSWEADPKLTVTNLAKQMGIELAEQKTTKEARTTQVSDDTVEILRGALPEDMAHVADLLAPAIKALVDRATGDILQKHITPLQERERARDLEALAAETKTELETFWATHKDAKPYETKMVEIGSKLLPADGSTTDEYLEMLFRLATLDDNEATHTRKTVERINKAAKEAGSSEPGVRSEIVTPKPPKDASFADAFAAAKRGERWE